MKMGRPPEGLAHVDRLDGPAAMKERLRVMLATITGEMSVEEACAKLGVGPSRLHAMRREALQGALEGLTPQRAGRPRSQREVPSERERALEAKVRALEVDLQAAFVNTEIALAMPHLFERALKKNSRVRKTKIHP